MFFCFRILRMICKVFWGTNGYMRKTGGTTISMSQQILGIYSSLKCRKGVNCCCIIDSNENGIDYVPTSQINLYSYSGWLYNQNLISSLIVWLNSSPTFSMFKLTTYFCDNYVIYTIQRCKKIQCIVIQAKRPQECM